MSRYIDADHLVQRATDVWGDCWDCTCQTVQDFVEYVNAEQTADVKPIVHGEWKWEGEYICSVCGGISRRMSYNFCPFCGADMRKESEEV